METEKAEKTTEDEITTNNQTIDQQIRTNREEQGKRSENRDKLTVNCKQESKAGSSKIRNRITGNWNQEQEKWKLDKRNSIALTGTDQEQEQTLIRNTTGGYTA